MSVFTKKQLTALHRTFAAQRQKREAEDAGAPEVVAIRITYDEPAPDGTFEILFMRRAEADKFKTSLGTSEIMGFAEGVGLAGRADCCGGAHALKEARRFQRINPSVQKLALGPF